MNTVPFSWFPILLQFSCLPPSYKVTRSPYNQKIFKELIVREKQMTCAKGCMEAYKGKTPKTLVMRETVTKKEETKTGLLIHLT